VVYTRSSFWIPYWWISTSRLLRIQVELSSSVCFNEMFYVWCICIEIQRV